LADLAGHERTLKVLYHDVILGLEGVGPEVSRVGRVCLGSLLVGGFAGIPPVSASLKNGGPTRRRRESGLSGVSQDSSGSLDGRAVINSYPFRA
jgi:hypothetical protein